jgi:hypothetical protein
LKKIRNRGLAIPHFFQPLPHKNQVAQNLAF